MHAVSHKKTVAKTQKGHSEHYLIVVRSWMLLVMFALMLGVGAVVGSYINQQTMLETPQVAGAQVEAQ